MPEGLELEGVPARIVEEHRRLLPRLAGVAGPRLDDERNTRGPDAVRHPRELLPSENGPEVRHGNREVLDLAGGFRAHDRSRRVGRDLIAEEVEIHPGFRASALSASEDRAVEPPGRGEIADVECE